MNRFVKGNSETCIGCRTCMLGCVAANEGPDIFKGKPGEYSFNPKLDIIKTQTISIAVQCKQCENPACLSACPVSAIEKREGISIIDKDRCVGCKMCMLACPYGAINMTERGGRTIANKCDLCAENNFDPQCVKICLTNSLTLVTESTLNESCANKRVNAAVGLAHAES